MVASKMAVMSEAKRKKGDAALKEAFGRVIRRWRDRRFLTQEELAGAADCSTFYVSQLERGKQAPSLIRIFDIAKALDVPPGQLLSDVADEFAVLNPREGSP